MSHAHARISSRCNCKLEEKIITLHYLIMLKIGNLENHTAVAGVEDYKKKVNL
ncbi:hypothetical protein CLV55_10632 [Flavobacterium aciduliphilum]|uniref:Uncharacterized protein n=1 Tax=Flavobacterium aciduliphilum TaxID=1101402 RepID=A0A328YEL2_9FLAO|nr:hypothetical protein CLV55_10632 [Flavobacterium aciduliphilum]